MPAGRSISGGEPRRHIGAGPRRARSLRSRAAASTCVRRGASMRRPGLPTGLYYTTPRRPFRPSSPSSPSSPPCARASLPCRSAPARGRPLRTAPALRHVVASTDVRSRSQRSRGSPARPNRDTTEHERHGCGASDGSGPNMNGAIAGATAGAAAATGAIHVDGALPKENAGKRVWLRERRRCWQSRVQPRKLTMAHRSIAWTVRMQCSAVSGQRQKAVRSAHRAALASTCSRLRSSSCVSCVLSL
jgi:hypothetical protein